MPSNVHPCMSPPRVCKYIPTWQRWTSFISVQTRTRSPCFVLQLIWHPCSPSSLFPRSVVSHTNAAFYRLRSVFISLKDDSRQLADWQRSVDASLSPSQSLSVAVACGRPQSHAIKSDSGFPRSVALITCCRCVARFVNRRYAGERADLGCF